MMNDDDIEALSKKISEMIDDMSGDEYLSNFVRTLTNVLKISSCCIYELEVKNGSHICTPLYISSDDYYKLIIDAKPGQLLVNNIIDNGIYAESFHSYEILHSDRLLLDHNTQSVAGFLVKNLNGNPLGLVVLIDDGEVEDLAAVKMITQKHVKRLNAELERVILDKNLNKSKKTLNYFVETSRDLIWEIDLEGVFLNVSRSSVVIYGYHREEMIGRHFSEFMSKDSALDFESHLEQCIQGNGIYDIVANHLNKNDRPIQVVYNAKPKYDYRGICVGFTGATTDITESVRAQIAVKNNSELFSAILSRLSVIFFSIDENGILTDIRGQGLKRMGVSDMDWVGKPGYGLFVGMDEMIDSALSGETVHFESSGTLEGDPWWFYTSMFFDSWTGFGAVGFAVDITDQKEIEEKLVYLLKDNRELAQRLVEVQEEERRNLARELHDELGQSITAVKSLATAITVKSGEGYSEVRSLGNSIIDLSGRLYDVVNTLMRRLRPDILDSLGFEATINSCIDNSQLEKTGVKCNINISGEINNLNEVVQITVYRIIQECLTNISKYAMASNINIFIERELIDIVEDERLRSRVSNDEFNGNNIQRDLLIIKVEDDGIGMDLDVDLQSSETNQKMGLQGIKERVTALGGEMSIESRSGEGVIIKAVLDLTTKTKSNGNTFEIKNGANISTSMVH